MKVLLFENEEEVSFFVSDPRDSFKPRQSFNIKGTRIFLDSYSVIDYYDIPNQPNNGKIKRVGNIAIDHYNISSQSNSGRLKAIKGEDNRVKLISHYSGAV